MLTKQKFIEYKVHNIHASRDEMVKHEHGTDPRLQGTLAQTSSGNSNNEDESEKKKKNKS